MKVTQFLDEQKVEYESISHRPTYDAQRLAQAVHTTGDEVAKTVLLRANNDYVLAVLPATHRLDLDRVNQILKTDDAELATELEFKDRFPDCEIGALPPFGAQYGMPTLADESLAGEDIVFEGNRHDEAIRMKFEDFRRIEQPVVGSFSQHVDH